MRAKMEEVAKLERRLDKIKQDLAEAQASLLFRQDFS